MELFDRPGEPGTKPSFSPVTRLRLVILVLVAAIVVGGFYYQGGLLNQARKWVIHTHDVREHLLAFFIKMKKMEDAQRRYIMTGNPAYLASYGSALSLDTAVSANSGPGPKADSSAFAELDTLRGLVADNPYQLQNLDSLRHLVDRRLVYARFIMRVRKMKGLDSARQEGGKGVGLNLSDSIQTLMGQMVEEEQRLADRRTRIESRSLKAHNEVIYGGFFLFFFGLLLLLWLESRNRKQRVKAERELSASNTLLSAIINGTDYAIFAANPEGIIEVYNKGAERMLGYRAEDNIGKSVLEITEKTFLKEELEARARRIVEQYGRPPQGVEIFRLPLKGESPLGQEWTNVRADGSHITITLSVWELKTESGEAQGSVAIVRDITRLKALERMKHDFISTVSHELRTPLTSIRGALGLVAGGATGSLPDQARELVSIAHRNSEQLAHIINDILDIEKIESGKFSIHLQSLDVPGFLRQALESNRSYADKFNVRFVLKNAAGVQVSADPDRLAQVLNNLLSNAAKFSSSGAEVWVEAESREATVRFSVRDFGPGIPEAFRPLIFEKFAQSEEGEAQRGASSGLGLSIAKRLVEAMRGSIGFETELGRGTNFFFDLPQSGS